jgi:hypothetical protein
LGQKKPFQAGNLTEKIPRIYREPDREYDRELKLNTPKLPRKGVENASKFELNGSGKIVDAVG